MSLKHKLGEFWLKYYLRGKIFERRDNERGSGIAVVFAGDSLKEQQDVITFVGELKKRKHEVYPFAYIPKLMNSKVTFGFPHFSKADFGVVPDFTRHKLSLFLQRSYDICFHIDLKNHLIVHYVAERVLASNKLSISPRYPKLYDIIVEHEDDETLGQVLAKTLDIFDKTKGK